MRRRQFTGLLTAFLWRRRSRAQESAAPQAGFAIAGVVVQAATNAPIGKALVQISLTTDRSKNRAVVTGPDGRFSFTNLPANKFTLTVTRASGMPQAYLAHGSFSSAIVTGADQNTANLVFRYRAPGLLAGTIVDESNEPVRNATVHLFAHQIDQTGIRRMVMANNTSTRASGKFRFANLTPGRYVVGVSGHPWFAQNQYGQHGYGIVDGGEGISFDRSRGNARPVAKPDPQFDVVYPLTYYPNTQEPASASAVNVTEGNETAIQISLRTAPSIHVKLTGGEAKPEGGTNINVQVFAVGPDNFPIPLNVGAFLQNGQGELMGVAAGRYQLMMNSFNAPGRRGMATAADEEMAIHNAGFGRRTVDLVDGATVDLGVVSHTSVKAVVKTATSDRPGNRIALMLRDRRTGNAINGMAAPDDTVRFPEANLLAGRYEVSLSNTPLFRILSLEAKGAKVVGGEVVIEDNSEVQLSVLIGRKSAVEVAGIAMKNETPLVGAMILLLPKTAAIGMRTYRDQSDSDGSFVFHGVAAGTYLALAIENGDELEFGNAAVLKPYLAGAATVTVTDTNAPPLLKLQVQQQVAG